MTRTKPGWKRPYLVAVGAQLRALREARGLSRQQLAERVGTNRGQIRKLEAGEGAPEPATITRLAAALDVDPAELIPTSIRD